MIIITHILECNHRCNTFFEISKGIYACDVAKCGSSTLKYLACNGKAKNWEATHIYTFCKSIDKIPKDVIKFAVWRDPIERVKSFWFQLMNGNYTLNVKIKEPTVDELIKAIEKEMQINRRAGEIEPHIRPQYMYYNPGDLDYIVPIEYLHDFLRNELHIKNSPPVLNSHKCMEDYKRWHFKDDEKQKIQEIYSKDYDIITENIDKVYNHDLFLRENNFKGIKGIQ